MLSILIVSCLAMIASIHCQTPTIVSRDEWGARPADSVQILKTPVSRVYIHHGAGPSSSCTTQAACSAIWKSYQDYDMDVGGMSDIQYNFGVGEDGRIYEGRGWTRVGSHTAGYNSLAVGICFIGDFMSRAPNAVAQQAAQDLIAYGVRLGWIATAYTLGGHRNAVGSTTCPGDELYEIIKTWPRFGF